MHRIGQQWVEDIEGMPHMVKCVGVEVTDYPQTPFYKYGILIKTELRDVLPNRLMVRDTPYADSYYRYICHDLGVMTDEILSCPFCGGEVHIGMTRSLPTGVEVSFICTQCNASTHICDDTVLQAVAMFNRRK